jgi:hypothetical protein
MKGIKHRNPMTTRNGKTNLKTLSELQLTDLLSKTSRKKEKHRITQRIYFVQRQKKVDITQEV